MVSRCKELSPMKRSISPRRFLQTPACRWTQLMPEGLPRQVAEALCLRRRLGVQWPELRTDRGCETLGLPEGLWEDSTASEISRKNRVAMRSTAQMIWPERFGA